MLGLIESLKILFISDKRFAMRIASFCYYLRDKYNRREAQSAAQKHKVSTTLIFSAKSLRISAVKSIVLFEGLRTKTINVQIENWAILQKENSPIQ